MRVAIISSSFYPAISYGGPISATWDIANGLAEKGIKVYVSTTNANFSTKLNVKTNIFLKYSRNLFIKYYNEEIINNLSLKFIFGVWSDIKKADFIYIQYIFNYTVFFSLLFSLILRKQVLLCPRGCLSPRALKYKHRIKKKLWLSLFIKPLISNIIWQASSYIEKEDILNIFKDAKIVEIADSVICDNFSNIDPVTKLDLVYNTTNQYFSEISELFFSMGRLHEIKGFDIVIDAFSLFLKDNPNAKLIIAGSDDGYKDKLIDQISMLNIENSVFLIGAINFNQKQALLANCSAFVLASKFESFGIVIAESLAAGTPVIVSNKTPWKDIESNKCGIFTENNSASFYNAFCNFKTIEFDRKNIKDYVLSNFDLKIVLNKFIDLIKNK